MKRKYKIRMFWGSLILIFALILSAQITNASSEKEFITITVHRGDTLWSVAKEYGEQNQDVRETIDEIKQLNHMQSGNLISGQTLKIPQ